MLFLIFEVLLKHNLVVQSKYGAMTFAKGTRVRVTGVGVEEIHCVTKGGVEFSVGNARFRAACRVD